ncbi:hypothetical protein DDE18_11585 [Nocardioides gansuensis]|uniref:Uncharacterized protein n=1 Tax=Nocardioides gansuensis TaxID=2138300 RepID=A0A2T8FB79_9ACTN|nr:hypothetical protein [Nocardioides gansuensis]PVG82971.1 hypothetical protein DDE18_11585 [Nocardioides gansuensis]
MAERLLAAAASVLLAAVLLTGCSEDGDDYCEAVAEHQGALSEIAASGEPAAVLGALDIYRDLREQAPTDLADEWSTVVGALADLDEALDAAGVDPASYDPKETPEGLSDAERTRIEGAARHLGEPGTRAAMAGIEQHALDVCKTPLAR